MPSAQGFLLFGDAFAEEVSRLGSDSFVRSAVGFHHLGLTRGALCSSLNCFLGGYGSGFNAALGIAVVGCRFRLEVKLPDRVSALQFRFPRKVMQAFGWCSNRYMMCLLDACMDMLSPASFLDLVVKEVSRTNTEASAP